MSDSTKKDDNEHYLTYSITARPANEEKGIAKEVATKKMPNSIDGGPKDFLEFVYRFKQLANLKKDLREAFEDAAFSDDDVHMDEKLTRAHYKALIVPVDYSEKLQEELWEIHKPRSESLEYGKRFRVLVRMEHTLARLSENSPMCEDALGQLYNRGLPYEWQNKYAASGHVYSTVAAHVPFFERIEQGEQRLQRSGGPAKRNGNPHQGRNSGRRSTNNNHRHGNSNNLQQHHRGGNLGRGCSSYNSSASTSNKYCAFHRTTCHNTQECRALTSKTSTSKWNNVMALRLLNNSVTVKPVWSNANKELEAQAAMNTGSLVG
ncbi:hypothetical protein GN244_ATG06781 [Phytophthora infestans]|uniref:Uncharacterized protein n=1 Tax=Phytophthora infestans TaxID=4787 RepID=A0A833SUM3_PHYIN|nr:hypothetical protein GN244_ATG06781 [Phytophthora infestans]